MSSPYLTGTLVEEVVEMVSCSGENIRLGRSRLSGGVGERGWRREVVEEEEVNEGAQDEEGRRGWRRRRRGEGSAESQCYPFMLHRCLAAALVLPCKESRKKKKR